MEYKYCLLWKRDGSEGIAWHIRGIMPDASFYGEIRFDSSDPSKRMAACVEGTIPSDDWNRCRDILEELSSQSFMEPESNYAVLIKWLDHLGNGKVVFQYNLGDEKTSDAARRFIQLKEFLEKEISKSYYKIK